MHDEREPDPLFLELWSTLPGIALAGGAYAVTLSLLAFPIILYQGGSLNSAAGTSFYGLVCMGPIASLYALFAGVLALMVVTCFVYSTGIQPPSRTLGSLAGGMAGYWSACAPFVVLANGIPDIPGTVGETATFLLFGPLATMCFGYIGARLYSPYGWFSTNVWLRLPASKSDDQADRSRVGFQVSIKNLLGMTIWAAIVVALVQATDSASGLIWAAVGIYVLAQTLLVTLDELLISWLERRRSRARVSRA